MSTTDRYQILDILGQGGMAVVYRAYDTQLEREVALKVLAAHLITESAFYQRFKREARIIATLEHPSIVPVYDVGIDEKRQPYLVMRLLRGGTLRDRRARGELRGADLWPPMRQVAAALDYAHGRNIVHRDIKPVNILFDEKGNAYVSDFGIAKVRDTNTGDLTGNLTGNSLLGTPAYMSPEQFEARPVDGRCDQYSLAVVLFEALTDRLPFAGTTPHVLMNQHLNDAPGPAHALNPALPTAVSAVLGRALEKNPAARYPSVSAFVHELEAATYQTAPPAHVAGPRPSAEQQQLEGYYRAGVEAYGRHDWGTAAAFLGRVVAIDVAYRDAAQLRRTAMQRLQDKRDAPSPPPPPRPVRPPPPIHKEAGGTEETPRPPVAQPRNARPWIVLGAGLLLLAALVAYVVWPTSEPEPPAVTAAVEAGAGEPALTEEATEAPPLSGGPTVAVIAAASDATVRCGAATTPLTEGDSLPPGDCRPLRVTGGEGVSELVLPDGTRLILDNDTAVNLLPGEGDAIDIQLWQGRLLVLGEAQATVANADGARASLDRAGVMGVFLDPRTLLFEIACLAGQCSVRGEIDDDAKALVAGQGGFVNNLGEARGPENADFDAYNRLAPGRVPTPTVTPTRTPAPTPTRTRTPASTPTLSGYATTPAASESISPTPDATETIRYSDVDRDGLFWHSDRCPEKPGAKDNEGCPAQRPTTAPTEPPEPTDTPQPGG